MSESEKFHRLAVEAGRIGTWDLDLQTEECLISPEMAELMDFSPEQTTVPGAQWQESIVPEDRTLMSSALAPSIASDTPFDLEFRIALKDGTQRWLYSRGAVSRDASGKAVRMYGASIDVTERKQADEKCANPKSVCAGQSKSKRSASSSSRPMAASPTPTTLFSE
jgi:PAS domain S-box-containing protein